ncbi:hypothetical protein PAHAL_5G291200 [Panicum hallii]|uniref:Uncharacterized protein n=1 Tax=Panicum hallii TaxID=206008 RepID=A0A2T8ILL8_9POAL|nr:hypothetical protein PAHAL_5G291200 [Panicum hallii]
MEILEILSSSGQTPTRSLISPRSYLQPSAPPGPSLPRGPPWRDWRRGLLLPPRPVAHPGAGQRSSRGGQGQSSPRLGADLGGGTAGREPRLPPCRLTEELRAVFMVGRLVLVHTVSVCSTCLTMFQKNVVSVSYACRKINLDVAMLHMLYKHVASV